MPFELGVSSACYYPLETEKALITAGEYGFKNIELFINAPSELSDEFVAKLIEIRDKYSMNIASVHPFFSFAESFFLFSDYERRYFDILPLYKRFFKVTSMLGAEIFVIHGSKNKRSITDGEYCRRFKSLIDIGKDYGVEVCHENVVLHRCETPEYMKMMRDKIGEDFKIVLDIKQAALASFTPYDFLSEMHESVRHIHISDKTAEKSCITPLKGDFDFVRFFKTLSDYSYQGKCVIELYNWSYESRDEIAEAYAKLNDIVQKIQKQSD